VDRIEDAFHRDGHITGRATGFLDLDNATSGLQPSDLVIVAGRPSMGKSTLAMQMAEHVAIYDKLPVAVFSMEMPDSQLGMRSLASTGRIDLRTIRTGKLDDQAWPRLTSAINILAEAKVFIDDSPALTPMDVRSRVRRLAKEQGQLGLVVVDYLQLMRVPGLEKNRVQEVSEISRSLKALAKEFNVPVIALSQLNRGLEQRPNKRPVMADLRDSGGIEQDADLILFIYRDEVYNKESQDKGTAEIIIGKQRNGPLSTVRLVFQGEYTRFENFAYSNGDGAEYGYEGMQDA
jgi:replicative DNA helicase